MVRSEARRDALVPDSFGESVPDGLRDLPMVLLCAARMLIISAPRLCYLVLKYVSNKCICIYLCHINVVSRAGCAPWADRSRSRGHDIWTLVSATCSLLCDV